MSEVYEGDPALQQKVSVSCHDCKLTVDVTISSSKTVGFCLCCGKPASRGC